MTAFASAIRAVVFDMDGVLSDSEPLINAAAVEMFREKGVNVRPEDFIPFVGTGEDRYIGGVAEMYGVPLDIASAKRRTYEIYLRLVEERLQSFPGAVELVTQCRQAGLKTAVASSADLIKIQANLRKIGLPIEGWDAVVSAEDVTHKKPAPDIFLAAARKLGLQSHECVVVEDAVNGVQAAKAAGMRCVAVAHTFPAERLAGADLIRPCIADLSLPDLIGAGFEQVLRQTTETDGPPIIVTPPNPMPDSFSAVPISRPRPTGPWGVWATLGMSVAIFFAFVSIQGMVTLAVTMTQGFRGKPIGPETLESGLVWGLATLAAAPVLVGGSWFFARLRKTMPATEYLALRLISGRTLSRWCGVLLAMVLAMDGMTVLLGRPIVPEVLVHAYRTAGILPLLWLAVVVLAPISEEIFFRGFMFPGLSQSNWGPIGAILLSSILWAVIHLQYDLFGVALIFVAGLVFGYARWRTGSVLTPIILHGIMNLIAAIQTAVVAR